MTPCKLLSLLFTMLLASISIAQAKPAIPRGQPESLKVGTIYASAGPLASVSLPMYMGLKLWADTENANGGVMVQPYGKCVPIKLIAYNDQSNTSTAAILYNRLITQDKVNVLVSGFGSTMTSIAVPIAQEHKMLLFNQSGTGAKLFTQNNPYIITTSVPNSKVWPRVIANFLIHKGPGLGIKRIAIIYRTDEYGATQNKVIINMISKSHNSLKVVYDQGVPKNTNNYTVLLNNIDARHPGAVIEIGYPENDIAFLRDLQSSGIHFKWVFSVFPGLQTSYMLNAVGVSAMAYTYTFVPPSVMKYDVNSGMNLQTFHTAWDKAYPNNKVPFGINSVVGYNTGLIIQNALAHTKTMQQLDLRKAIFGLSGKLKTVDGTFILSKEGSQIGELMPLAQLVPNDNGGLKFTIVYLPNEATGKSIYPAPTHAR